jgi:MFS family permease
VGGSGVLFLAPVIGFPNTYWFVGACILVVNVLVVLPMREPAGPPRPPREGSALGAVSRELWRFVTDAFRAFTGTRAAWVGVINALLPAGAFALGLALQSNLAVELGLDDTRVGLLNLWSTVISALCCVAGGWISDRFGRRRSLALFIFGTTLPTFYLAWAMQQAGWIMPVPPQMPGRPAPPDALIAAFWAMVLVYNVFQGLYYGTRAALFMDITTPRVAATQFTAYMAMQNLVIAYSATWQGWLVERWGYPRTLVVDCLFGLVGLALLPLMGATRKGAAIPVGAAVPEAIEP